MSVPTDMSYPVIATDAAWQKKKSFIDKAKASTKTGLGADLKAAELKWKAIPWKDLDATKLAAKSVEAAQRQLDTAKAAGTAIQEAKTASPRPRQRHKRPRPTRHYRNRPSLRPATSPSPTSQSPSASPSTGPTWSATFRHKRPRSSTGACRISPSRRPRTL